MKNEKGKTKNRVKNFSLFIFSFSLIWSSTTNVSDSSNAWNVNFNNGNDNWNSKTNENRVRCVRGGE